MTIGSRIKELRKENNLTQEQLANVLSITPQAVSRWENGTAMPDISMLIPIANVFKTSTDYLLGVSKNSKEKLMEVFLSKEIGLQSMEEKEEYFRNTVRDNPTSLDALEFLNVSLAFQDLGNRENEDIQKLKEQMDICARILELGGGVYGKGNCIYQIAELAEKVGTSERALELIKDAPNIESCHEVLAAKAAAPENKESAYKTLLARCVDFACESIYRLFQYVSTEADFEALNKAEGLLSTVYGKEYFYQSVSIDLLYLPVQAFYKKGNIDQAISRLTQIVDLLEYRQHEMMHKPTLLNLHEYGGTLVFAGTFGSPNRKAESIIDWIKDDFSDEHQKTTDVVHILKRLTAIAEYEDEKLEKYIDDGFDMRFSR